MGIQINGQTDTVTATDGSINIGGDVTVPGVLTYEDVTSVDAVGLSTFQNGIHVTGGSVGIGTDNPDEELEVFGDIKLSQTSTRLIFEDSNSSNLSINRINSYDGAMIMDVDSNNDGDFASTFRVSIDGSERLRIKNNGDVGIGTDNPGTIESWSPAGTYLHVRGTNASGVIMESNYPRLVWNEMDQGANSAIFQINMSEGQTQFQHINDDGSIKAERLRISSDGNIGINQTSPSEKLEIYAGDLLLSSNAIGVSGGNGPEAALKFEYNGHQYAKIVGQGRDSSGYGDIDFYTSSGSGVSNLTQRMTIRDNGSVGINSTSPGRKLDVVDSGANGSVIRSRVTTNNGGYLAYEALNSSGTSVFSVTHNGRINLSENIVFASGQGIDFSATANTGSSGATNVSELLDDYEEGDWIPTMYGSATAGTTTYSHQTGHYTKIGNRVIVSGTVAATTSGAGGNLRIGNFPFVSGDESVGTFQANELASWQSGVEQYSLIIQTNNSHCEFRGTKQAAAFVTLQIQNVTYLRFNVSYQTNS